MPTLVDRLKSNFVLINLGASGDADYRAPPELLKTVTLVELDAGPEPAATLREYHIKHTVKEFVSGVGDRRVFYSRANWMCSGLAAHREQVVERYGLQEFYKLSSAAEVETRALPDLLSTLGIARIDFLKTDLDGLDTEVLRAMHAWLPQTLGLQCELRFEPFYEGEPPCEDAMGYLRSLGFDLIGLKPEFWKPVHPERAELADGNVAWADFAYLRNVDSTLRLADEEKDVLPLVKHIFLAAILREFNYACTLLQVYRHRFQPVEIEEIVAILKRFLELDPGAIDQHLIAYLPYVSDPAVNVR